MLIGVKKRFVFVANSKTASTSIEKALISDAEINRGGSPQRKHITMAQALRIYDFLFDQPAYGPETFFKFGVMRDPMDWIQSWFRFRKGNKVANPLPPDLTFEEFWQNRDWNIQRADGSKFLQRGYFTDKAGRSIVDVIIPYHDITSHFAKIAEVLDVQNALPRSNVSNLSKNDGGLPKALIEEMRDFYAPDYELLNQVDDINRTGYARFFENREVVGS